jgi:hypothetical protein
VTIVVASVTVPKPRDIGSFRPRGDAAEEESVR